MPPDCWCGHTRDAHQHYRPGSDCAVCDCLAFGGPDSQGVPMFWVTLVFAGMWAALIFTSWQWGGL